MPQKSRPVMDLFNSGWAPPQVYEQVDEAQPSDADYVSSSPCGAQFSVKVPRPVLPLAGPQTLTLRLAGPGKVLVELFQRTKAPPAADEKLIASTTFELTSAEFTDQVLTLTLEETARIDYNPKPEFDLSLRVQVTVLGQAGSGVRGCAECLRRLFAPKGPDGYVRGVFYTTDDGRAVEVLTCGSGGWQDDSPACVACLERLCFSTDGQAVTAISYTDDSGIPQPLPPTGRGGSAIVCVTDMPSTLNLRITGAGTCYGTATCNVVGVYPLVRSVFNTRTWPDDPEPNCFWQFAAGSGEPGAICDNEKFTGPGYGLNLYRTVDGQYMIRSFGPDSPLRYSGPGTLNPVIPGSYHPLHIVLSYDSVDTACGASSGGSSVTLEIWE